VRSSSASKAIPASFRSFFFFFFETSFQHFGILERRGEWPCPKTTTYNEPDELHLFRVPKTPPSKLELIPVLLLVSHPHSLISHGD
jgi:hypothetical protein